MANLQNADLLRQIEVLTGAINRHETQRRHAYRTAPYARARGPSAHATKNRNRSLVMNRSRDDVPEGADLKETSKWISSRDRGHLTLTNPAVYDTTTAAKLARIHESHEAKRKARLTRREAKEAERLRYLASTTLVHEGITYRFNKHANLLVRMDTAESLNKSTPGRTLIHGIEFLKSPKTNNLFRRTTIIQLKDKRKSTKSSKKYCKYYTRYGICKRAKDCPYEHDAKHLAICPHFLSSHGCDESRVCNLSHTPLSQNTPTCTHFIRGSCTKPECRYAHASVTPSAPVCPNFARNGYCSQGITCDMRHARECPLFSNKGACVDVHCKLPHIARAGTSHPLVPATVAQVDASSQHSESDSDYVTDEYESEDFDEHAFGDYVKL